MPLKVKKVTGPTIAASVLFNGSSQYLSIASDAGLAFGSGDYTIECWLYITSQSGTYNTFYGGQSAGSYIFNVVGAGAPTSITINPYGSSNTVSISYSFSLNTWYHVSATRASGNTKIFINGTQIGSTTVDNTNYTQAVAGVGGISTAAQYFAGNISNLRILKGTALYTSNFTPSTSPLTAIANTSLLTCHDTTIRDASVNNFTITNNNTATVSSVAPFTAVLASSMKFKKTITTRIGRSVLFDGTNQYLSLPNTGALNLGSNNFTIEAWVYPTSVSGNKNIFYINGNASSYSAICLYIQNSKFAFLANQTGGYPWTLQIGEVGPTISSNTWYHVATTRSGNSFYVFVNGTLVSGAPYSLSGALFNGTINSIGYQAAIASYFTGYISNARIINGTALYTASFTAPTSPLTAIANTSLLTCNAPTIVDSSSNNFAITNNNAATVSTTNPFGADTVSGTFKVKKSAGVYMIATGGDLVTTSGSYKIHTFTTVGTSSFVVSSLGSTPIIECLLVGGGGGGGGRAMAGGGGGGGVVYTSSALLTTGSFSAIVGAGGIAATGMQASSGQNGGNTLFTYNSITTTVLGGGGGATEGYVGLNGANGGGGTNGNGAGGAGIGGGFPGGSGSAENYLTRGCGGGGGGAGGAGVRGVQGIGGNGGIGAIYNITGSAYYGGGGGGGGQTNAGGATAGAGGLGGGGLGGRTSPGTAGTANTGGGGGGGGYTNTTGASETNGGNGGSGIILIKYRYTD